MIAADTSSLVCFLSGVDGIDVDAIRLGLRSQNLLLPPVVLSELVSAPDISNQAIKFLKALPLLEVENEFWLRAGLNRGKILKRKLKAKVADSLIAQACIDADIPLITRDNDFLHFKRFCGLRLAAFPEAE